MNNRKLRRSKKDSIFAGVCGGLAEYLDLDSSLVRLAWVALTVFAGMSIWVYIIALILIPSEDDFEDDYDDYKEYDDEF